MGPKKELQQEVPSASTSTTTTTTTIATSTPSDSSDTAPSIDTPSSSSSRRPRRWLAATRGSDNSSDEEGDTPAAAAPSQQPLASSNSSSSSSSSGNTVVQEEPVSVKDHATAEDLPGGQTQSMWAPTAGLIAEAFAGDSTLSRIQRAVAEHLLQAQPSYSQPWGQIANQVAVLKQLRLQEWQAVRQALVEDPRFVEGSKDMGNMNATIGLALDRCVWPGRPDSDIPPPAELRSACQQAFEGTTEALQLMRAVSEVILDQAPVSFSMRWPDVVQGLQSRGTPIDSTAYSQLSSHPAFGISFRDARVTITLKPALLRGQDISSHQPEQQQQSQSEGQSQLSTAPHLQSAAQQGVESSAQARQLQHKPLNQAGQEGQPLQRSEQNATSADVPAAIQAAFPGDSLAAQLMREVAEIVVANSPDRWRERSAADERWKLNNSRVLELGLVSNQGLAKVPHSDRFYWRQAIAEHPAWEVELPSSKRGFADASARDTGAAAPTSAPSTPMVDDYMYVLSKQQLLRLAADPAAAAAAVAQVQAAYSKLAQLGLEEAATYIPRFKMLALKELENKQEQACKDLCALILAQDTELRDFFQRARPPPQWVVLWLKRDPRFHIDPNAGRWTASTKVRLTVPDPSSTPAPLLLASPDGDPATSKVGATSDSTRASSAAHMAQATAMGFADGEEGDNSTPAAGFTATLRPTLLHMHGQGSSSGQLDQQPSSEVQAQLGTAPLVAQLQATAQQGAELSPQAQAQVEWAQQYWAEEEDQQQQGQLLQRPEQDTVSEDMLAAIQAAFPGDSLAAQLMREIAEIVVSDSPDTWRLISARVGKLGVVSNKGLAKVPKPDRFYWRQAIAEHPAWGVEPSMPRFDDYIYVLSKQQLLRLAADPAAAEAAVAQVQAAYLKVTTMELEDSATYILRFKALALKELAKKQEAKYGELCAPVLAQDTELHIFFHRNRPRMRQVLGWLSEDPRFQVDPSAGDWTFSTMVRLSPASTLLSQATPGGNPATSKGSATSDSKPSSSATHVPVATPVSSSGGSEGDSSSTTAARFRALAAARLSPGVPARASVLISAAICAGLLPQSTDRPKERGKLAWQWLSEDPRFQQSWDELGNNYITLMPAQQQQEQPMQPPMAEEMQLVVHPDGTAHLVPGSSTGNSDESATPPHPSDADIQSFLNLLPDSVSQAVQQHLTSGTTGQSLQELSAVWLDYGRPIRLQFRQGPSVVLTGTQGSVEEALGVLQHQSSSTGPLSQESVSAMFDSSNRATRRGTLHRVTAMRGIDGSSITGLTYKVGCSQSGGAAILGDVLHRIKASIHDSHTPAQGAAQAPEGAELCLAPPRVLLVTGRIGTGKTTLLRDMARYLADDCGLAVVVVDTHGDMGGASSVPHAALGSARRMEVGNPIEQHVLLNQAVLGHAPEVLVVDEILTHKDVAVVRSSAQRGIPVVCGVSLAQLEVAELRSHHLLSPLFPRFTKGAKATSTTGGNGNSNQQVPVGCTMLAEVLAPGRVRLHPDLESSISRAAAGQQPATQLRRYDGVNVWVRFETDNEAHGKSTTEPGTDGDSSSGSDTEHFSSSQAHGQQAEKEQRRRSLFSNNS